MSNETTVTVGYVHPEFTKFGNVSCFEVGEVIKISWTKKFYLVIQDIQQTNNELTITNALHYKPSPKSQLRRKTRNYFTKNKYKLLL